MKITDSLRTQLRSPRAEGGRPDRRRWLWLAILALLIVQGVCFVALPMAANAGDRGMLPVSLRALEEADYSVDPMGTNQPQLQFAIVGDVLRDLEPEATDIDSRITALEESMQTPIATDAEPTEVVASTLTPTDTATGEPSGTPTEGLTGTASPSATSTPGPSTTPTATLAASATQTPTSVSTLTATVAPTQTPSTVPSATSVPTATPAPTLATVSCSMFSLSSFETSEKWVRWELNSGSPQDAEISAIFIVWPGTNGELKKIHFAKDKIWEEGDDTPPALINSDWEEDESRTIEAGKSEPLEFQFQEIAAGSGYDLRVTLDNGCEVLD